jgi:hypothetical protein
VAVDGLPFVGPAERVAGLVEVLSCLWAQAEPVCASEDISFDEYLKSIGDDRLVIDMLVGDLQRIIECPARGFAIAEDVPADVTDAYQRLIAAGYDSRLMTE